MTRPAPPARRPPTEAPRPRPSPQKHKAAPPAFKALLAPGRAAAEAPPLAQPALAAPSGRPEKPPARSRDAELPLDGPQARPAQPDLLDPMARALALPLAAAPEAAREAAPPAPLAAPDEVLLDRLVKRLSWGGNGRRGSARIELGAGSLAGATLLIHADGRELTLEIEGADLEAAREFTTRIGQRLADKGIALRQT